MQQESAQESCVPLSQCLVESAVACWEGRLCLERTKGEITADFLETSVSVQAILGMRVSIAHVQSPPRDDIKGPCSAGVDIIWVKYKTQSTQ